MAGSTFGTLFKLSTFGESHGDSIGGIIEGFPAGFSIDFEFIQHELDRRKPGQSKIVTQRKESDQVRFLSGIFEGKSTGAPIAFMIQNENAKSDDYEHLKNVFRPSHADYTYEKKYGHRDWRGGGRSSARETIARVVAGALAKQVLKAKGIEIFAFVDRVGEISMSQNEISQVTSISNENIVRCPDELKAKQMEELILNIRKEGDTIGGSVFCKCYGVPVGLGEPVFEKLNAVLGQAMFSINAVKGVEFGSGFESIKSKGSELNDAFNSDFSTKTNNSGGIQGGISNGMPIEFRVAFKPVATLMQDQDSFSQDGKEIVLKGKGRHDPCVLPRAVVIVESMVAIVLLDFFLRQSAYSLD
jgi:chorismate synthase